MSRGRVLLGLTFAPLALGLVLAALMGARALSDPTLYVELDAALLIILVGLAATGSLLAMIALLILAHRERRRGRDEALAESAADRRRLMQRLDHELKNPLTAIQAGAANLAEAPGEPDRRYALHSIVSQASRLSRLASDLRKLADLEQRELEQGSVDLGEIVEEVRELAEERPEATGKTLVVMVPRAWPLSRVTGDRDLLFLVVHNLVDNALKFTAPGDRVEVRAFEEKDSVTIEVADTGPGIPPEELPYVWEELARGRAARGVAGSGIGLALVRAIVARHGGETAVRSRPAEGTVFTVRLPRS